MIYCCSGNILPNKITSELLISAGAPFTAGAAYANGWFYGKAFCITYAFAMAISGKDWKSISFLLTVDDA